MIIATHTEHYSIYDELLGVNHADDMVKVEQGPDGERNYCLRNSEGGWMHVVIDTD